MTVLPDDRDMTAVWTSAEWRAAAETWILDRLAEAGLEPTGPIEQPRVRPWSTQLTVPTARGRFWFKENSPAMTFEAGLVEAIAELAPGRVLTPLAVDRDRGWLLGPDGGPTVREQGTDEAAFTRILTEYAELQQTLAGRTELLDAGLPPLEPAGTADHVDRQVAELAALPPEHPLHADADLLACAARNRSKIIADAELLAEVPVPSTLQHNDLHQNNAFAPGAGPLKFFDFGDAVWGHPFCSLTVTRGALCQEWSCPPEDPRIERLILAYLECWTDLAPLAELRRMLEPALRIGELHRYNSWHRLVPYLPDEMIKGHVGYLRSLLCGAADGSG